MRLFFTSGVFKLFLFIGLVVVGGCYTEHKVELEVKPMHITIDVNVKVDQALDDFFGEIDEQNKTMKENTK